MKILYFNYLYDVHGASIGSVIKPLELFAAMQKLGHEVKLCFLKEDLQGTPARQKRRQMRQLLKQVFARFVHDPKLLFENAVFLQREKKLVKEFQPDLIVARLDLYLFSAIHTARQFGLPIIIEADSPPVYEATEFQKQYWRIASIPKKIEKWVLQQADYIVAQSNALREYFVEKHAIDRHKIAVVTNAADVNKFEGAKKNKELVDRFDLSGKQVLGFIGSMSAWHGIENLLQIMETILIKFPDSKFLLIGSGGGQDDRVQKFVAQHGFERRVLMPGYIAHDEIPAYLALMDVVLAPYPRLPFFYYSPVKIFEYMAAGKPVVTTAIGQIEEIIEHNVNGILCRADDFEQINRQIERLLMEPQERARIGENARRTIAERHTWMHKAQQWDKICSAVLDGLPADAMSEKKLIYKTNEFEDL